MSYLPNQNAIHITCKGTTETTFTGASFRASVTTYGKTGPAAKEEANKTIANIRGVVFKHAKLADVDTERLRTSFGVDVHRPIHGAKPEGYKATYTIAFTARNVLKAIALHDDLTSIEGVEALTPIFRTDESPEVQARAFKDAVGKAEKKFFDQCVALKLGASNYHAQAWGTDEDRDRERGGGKTLSIANSSDDKAISVEPGKATYEVTVTVAYVRKSEAPQGPQPA